VSAFWGGVVLGARRLRDPRVALGALIALVAVVVAARLERSTALEHAADRVLFGAVFGMALPLCCYGLIGRAVAAQRLDGAVSVLARHGSSGRALALGLLAVSATSAAVLGAVLAAAGVLAARGMGDAALLGDALSSARIGLLAGASYAAWLGFGASIGRRGGGRFWALVVDWMLGTGTTALAVPWPRAHVRNLLGGEPVLALAQGWSTLALALLCATFAALAVARTAR
jgi:hypothetical protein